MRNHTHKRQTMQPFPGNLRACSRRRLAGRPRGWYTSPVPPRSSMRSPGPLDNLPRPLSERERAGRGRRRLLTAATVAVVVVAVVGASQAGAARSRCRRRAGRRRGRHAGAGRRRGDTATRRPVSPPPAPPDATPTGMDGIGRPDAARGPDAPPASRLTGYRWPLAARPRDAAVRPVPVGLARRRRRALPRRRSTWRRSAATGSWRRTTASSSPPVATTTSRWAGIGDLGPYLARLDKKQLWSTLPIVVVIDDGNGYRSIYAHFGKIIVKRGQTVKAGKLIGYEGATGRASGCHLHYGLFSPAETRPVRDRRRDVAKRMKLPRYEIARIDPLLVLPPRTKAPKPTPTPNPNAQPDARRPRPRRWAEP